MNEKPNYSICQPYTSLHAMDELKFFVQLSCELTGFSEVELFGTGQVPAYFKIITDYLDRNKEKLDALFSGLTNASASEENTAYLRALLNEQGRAAKVAATLIKLWYLGQWYDPENPNETMIPSSQSYANGLVWTAIQAHPQGAKQQGYAAWSVPPLASKQA